MMRAERSIFNPIRFSRANQRRRRLRVSFSSTAAGRPPHRKSTRRASLSSPHLPASFPRPHASFPHPPTSFRAPSTSFPHPVYVIPAHVPSSLPISRHPYPCPVIPTRIPSSPPMSRHPYPYPVIPARVPVIPARIPHPACAPVIPAPSTSFPHAPTSFPPRLRHSRVGGNPSPPSPRPGCNQCQ